MAKESVTVCSNYAILKPDGRLVAGPNGAPQLYPTAGSASRSGKTTRGNVVVPVALEWRVPS